ncbi:MAG: hypothetical protein Q9222_003056 [Ikaeria aurantiellina]
MSAGLQEVRRIKPALIDGSRFDDIDLSIEGEQRQLDAGARSINEVVVSDICSCLHSKCFEAKDRFQAYIPASGIKALRPSSKRKSRDSMMVEALLGKILGMDADLDAMLLSLYTVSTESSARSHEKADDEQSVDGLQDDSEAQPANLQFSVCDFLIRRIFHICLNGPNRMAVGKDDLGQAAQRSANRLHLWGIGLFEETMSLDGLLHESGCSAEPLREIFVDAFVEIAIAEEQILQRWALDTTRVNRRALEDARLRITVMLGTKKVSELAKGKWRVILAERAAVGEYSDALNLHVIQRTIEALYDVLPAVRGLRRVYVLRLEAAKKVRSPEPKTRAPPVEEKMPADNAPLIAKNVEHLTAIVRAAASETQDSKAMAVSGKMEKTRTRLEELGQSLVGDEQAILKIYESEEARKMQERVSRELGKYTSTHLRLNLVQTTTDARLEPYFDAISGQRVAHSREKHPKVKSLCVTTTVLEQLVRSLDVAVSHLYFVSGRYHLALAGY